MWIDLDEYLYNSKRIRVKKCKTFFFRLCSLLKLALLAFQAVQFKYNEKLTTNLQQELNNNDNEYLPYNFKNCEYVNGPCDKNCDKLTRSSQIG